tara:strand:+ start:1795 stop:2250 length:456 start_codon:yes stop_codon:yes gene_type:complete
MSISLYIPIIQRTTTDAFVKKIFAEKHIGQVSRVDFVYNKEKNRNEAFVHFDYWFDSDSANQLKITILDSTVKSKIYYNDKQYWPLLINKNPNEKKFNPKYIDQNKLFEQEKQLDILKKQLFDLEKAYVSQDYFKKQFTNKNQDVVKRSKR